MWPYTSLSVFKVYFARIFTLKTDHTFPCRLKDIISAIVAIFSIDLLISTVDKPSSRLKQKYIVVEKQVNETKKQYDVPTPTYSIQARF